MLLLKQAWLLNHQSLFWKTASFLTLPGASSEKNKSQDSSRKPEAVSVFVGGKGRVGAGCQMGPVEAVQKKDT